MVVVVAAVLVEVVPAQELGPVAAELAEPAALVQEEPLVLAAPGRAELVQAVQLVRAELVQERAAVPAPAAAEARATLEQWTIRSG